MKATLFALVLLILGCATGCNLLMAIPQDDSILTQKPCRFPCWRGLTPGSSTTSDIQQVIHSDTFIIAASQLRTGEDGLNRTVYQWWYDRVSRSNRLIVENDVLDHIEIVPNVAFTLKDVITLYGEPTALNAFLETSQEGGVVDADLLLYYPQLGLEVGFKIEGGSVLTVKKFDVKPDTPGGGFRIYKPQSSLEGLIAEMYRIEGNELKKFVSNSTLGWPGFNSVIVINPDQTAYYDATFILTATPSPSP